MHISDSEDPCKLCAHPVLSAVFFHRVLSLAIFQTLDVTCNRHSSGSSDLSSALAYFFLVFSLYFFLSLMWIYLKIAQQTARNIATICGGWFHTITFFQQKVCVSPICVFPIHCAVFSPAGHRALPAFQNLTFLMQQEGCLSWQSKKYKNKTKLHFRIYIGRHRFNWYFATRLER